MHVELLRQQDVLRLMRIQEALLDSARVEVLPLPRIRSDVTESVAAI